MSDVFYRFCAVVENWFLKKQFFAWRGVRLKSWDDCLVFSNIEGLDSLELSSGKLKNDMSSNYFLPFVKFVVRRFLLFCLFGPNNHVKNQEQQQYFLFFILASVFGILRLLGVFSGLSNI